MIDLIKWNPWEDMSLFRDRFNRLFESATRNDDGGTGLWYPAADLMVKDDAFVIKAELPGLNKEDISLDVENGVLTLKGERKLETEVNEANVYRRELSYGKFVRSFRLPASIDPDTIKAEFKNGLLIVEVPKPEGQKPKQITVN
jgi:HSP20 family protein